MPSTQAEIDDALMTLSPLELEDVNEIVEAARSCLNAEDELALALRRELRLLTPAGSDDELDAKVLAIVTLARDKGNHGPSH